MKVIEVVLKILGVILIIIKAKLRVFLTVEI